MMDYAYKRMHGSNWKKMKITVFSRFPLKGQRKKLLDELRLRFLSHFVKGHWVATVSDIINTKKESGFEMDFSVREEYEEQKRALTTGALNTILSPVLKGKLLGYKFDDK